MLKYFTHGEVAEWLKAPVLKTGKVSKPSRVRLPPSPPRKKDEINYEIVFFSYLFFSYTLVGAIPFVPPPVLIPVSDINILITKLTIA